jgi:hypothetical protein
MLLAIVLRLVMGSIMSQQENKPSKLDECMELYKEGAGDVEIADHLGLTLKAFRDLCDTRPEFREFVERGSTVAQAWWWRQGRKNLAAKGFNATMWAFNMKNRYGWAEKTDSTTSGDLDLSLDVVKRQLEQAMKELGKKNPELVRQLNIVEKTG